MSTPSLQQIGNGIYAWIGANGDSNAGAVVTPSGLLAIDAQQTRALGSRFRSAVDDAIAHEVRLPQYAAMPRYREWLGAERTRGVPIFETALMTTSTVLRSG